MSMGKVLLALAIPMSENYFTTKFTSVYFFKIAALGGILKEISDYYYYSRKRNNIKINDNIEVKNNVGNNAGKNMENNNQVNDQNNNNDNDRKEIVEKKIDEISEGKPDAKGYFKISDPDKINENNKKISLKENILAFFVENKSKQEKIKNGIEKEIFKGVSLDNNNDNLKHEEKKNEEEINDQKNNSTEKVEEKQDKHKEKNGVKNNNNIANEEGVIPTPLYEDYNVKFSKISLSRSIVSFLISLLSLIYLQNVNSPLTILSAVFLSSPWMWINYFDLPLFRVIRNKEWAENIYIRWCEGTSVLLIPIFSFLFIWLGIIDVNFTWKDVDLTSLDMGDVWETVLSLIVDFGGILLYTLGYTIVSIQLIPFGFYFPIVVVDILSLSLMLIVCP